MDKKTYAEDIVKKIKEIEKEKDNIYNMENNIKNGFVVVKYKKLEVETRTLADGAFDMCIPKTFEVMSEEHAKVKYPSQDRPQFIYTNEDTTVNLTFSIEKGDVGSEEIEEVKDMFVKYMHRLYPASQIEDDEIITGEENKIGCFSFEVPLVDGEIYNFMFFVATKKGLLMGTFSCNIYEKKQWRPIIKQMLITIREKDSVNK